MSLAKTLTQLAEEAALLEEDVPLCEAEEDFDIEEDLELREAILPSDY